jgi:hypothetical protein
MNRAEGFYNIPLSTSAACCTETRLEERCTETRTKPISGMCEVNSFAPLVALRSAIQCATRL